jgi:hypothetical protein
MKPASRTILRSTRLDTFRRGLGVSFGHSASSSAADMHRNASSA